MKIILASGSPNRRKLLADYGIDAETVVSGADESVPDGLTPGETVKLLSKRKADAVFGGEAASGASDTVVIAADTVVYLDGAVLNKPSDAADAKRMLTAMSGRRHTVYTGVTMRSAVKSLTFAESTEVEFYPLTEREIDDYVKSGEPFGRAGAYGIQKRGAALVKRIDGDYFNVVGLPLAAVVRRLRYDFNADI